MAPFAVTQEEWDMRLFVAAAALALLSKSSVARPIKVWTYQELYTNADFVAVVTVVSITLSTNATPANPDPRT